MVNTAEGGASGKAAGIIRLAVYYAAAILCVIHGVRFWMLAVFEKRFFALVVAVRSAPVLAGLAPLADF